MSSDQPQRSPAGEDPGRVSDTTQNVSEESAPSLAIANLASTDLLRLENRYSTRVAESPRPVEGRRSKAHA